jgi:hypothetical protein
MIRRVAYKKAVLAGTLGALAWEAAARLLIWFGLPLFDLVYVLGSMIFGAASPVWQWWTAGISMHALVGSVWAVFYAYFFWSAFDCRPVVQGIIFSLFPALLAGFFMIPQMDFMLDGLSASPERYGFFAARIGWGGPFAVFLGHLVYGAVMGSIYTKPVGYPSGSRKALRYG